MSVPPTRFAPPAARFALIERVPLRDLPLRGALLVQAPAGYGKTTLLGRLWRDRKPAQGFNPWLSLAPSHRAFNKFREDLAGALASAGLAPTLLSGSPEEDGALLGDFLSARDKPAFLTLDDYHTAATPEIESFARSLLAASYGSVCVAIGARERPAIGAAALAARGDLVRLGPADLSFSLENAKALFQGALEDQALAALYEQTEGWPAALQLAWRALEARGAAKNALGICATGGEMGAYLAEETFDPLPDDLKAFLVETALLETLDAQGADTVRQRHDSAAVLDILEKSGALLFPTDGGRACLRRHGLLRAFLEARFALLAPDVRAAIGERTVEFLSREGNLRAALALAQRICPSHRRASLFEATPSTDFWSAEALVGLAGELANLDEVDLASAPRLAALRSVGLHEQGRAQDARRSADEAASALHACAAQVAARKPEAQCDALVWDGLRAALFDETVAEAAVMRLAETAQTMQPGRTLATLAHTASVLTLRAGSSADARALARWGVTAAQRAEAPDRILAFAGLGLTALYDGAMDEAARALHEAREIAALTRGAPFRAALDICVASLRTERSQDRGAAAPAWWSGASLVGFSPEILIESARVAVRSALSAGDSDAARGHLKRAREAAVANCWRRAESVLCAEELALTARAGERKAAAALARELKRLGGLLGEGALALAIFEMETDDPARARERLAALLSRRQLPRRLRMRGLVLDARAAVALDAMSEASSSLGQYLGLSGEGVMAASFFEDGAADLWDLLLALAPKLAPVAEQGRRLDAVADLAIARPYLMHEAALAPPTAQEIAMFTALRRSGARAEAARALKMSENTLKFYLKRVFQKWRVNDWRLAVKIAERLGVLDEVRQTQEAAI